MNRMTLLALAAAAAAQAAPAFAQDGGPLRRACAEAAQSYFGEPEARTETRRNDDRVDGTRTVNGDIYLEARKAGFMCGFPPRGDGHQLVEFFVDGRDRLAELRAKGHASGGASAAGQRIVEVSGVPSNNVLNVRSGPGTGNQVVGALANGDEVRELECREVGGSRWCRIQMLDEMRSEGWVNARYLGR